MSNRAIMAAEKPPAPHPATWIFPLVVLLASLTATFFLWNFSAARTRLLAEIELNEHAQQISNQILKRLEENETILLGGEALFSVRGDALKRQEWRRYASSLKFDRNNPGVLGFGFAAWTPQSALQEHLRAIRAEGFPDYAVRPAGDRPFHTPIIWLEPFTMMNQRAFGYDMYAEPVRRAAMTRALDTGRTSVSDKVILVQEGQQDVQSGILMYVPSYRSGMPTDTVEQRRAALRGFVYSPIRMDDFTHAALVNMPGDIDIAVYCAPEATEAHLLFSNRPSEQSASHSAARPAFSASKTIDAFGSPWFLTFSGRSSFEHQFNSAKSTIILFAGAFASLLLAALAWMQTRSRSQALVIARQAKDELLSRQKIALHIQQTPLAVIEWNTRLEVTAWNQAAENIFGYSPEEALGAHLSFLFAPEDQEPVSAELRALLSKQPNSTARRSNRTKDGRAIVCAWYCAALFDHSGEPLGAAALAQDVTAAQTAEERLRTERNLLSSVMNGTRNAHLVYLDRDFNFIDVNHCYAASCGYQPAEMVGKNHFALYPDEENQAIFRRVRDTGEPAEVHDKPFVFPDQPERGTTWWDWTLTPVKNWTGEVIGLVFSLVETTDRKKAEMALRASETLFRLLFEQHSAIMLLINPDTGDILNANESASRFYGSPRATLRRHNIRAITALPKDKVEVVLREIRENKKKHFTAVHRLADGSIRNVEAYVTVIPVDEQWLAFAIVHDITDRVQAEEERDRLEAQNRQLQKTESLSRMAGAITHHVNNQLQAVMMSLELVEELAEAHPGLEEIRETTATAIHSTEKAAEISRLLLTYLARVPIAFETLDLSDVCRKARAVWQARKPGPVDFRIDLPEAGPLVNANPSQLQMLITNLTANALEACEDRRGVVSLTLTVCGRDDIPASSRHPVDFQPTDLHYACMEVADTGCGIPWQCFDQLFDPFYSTKFTGRGMGLPVVLGIVRAHKGVVTVESQVGGGSVFRVYLPMVETILQQNAAPVPPDQPLPGRGAVLPAEGAGSAQTTQGDPGRPPSPAGAKGFDD